MAKQLNQVSVNLSFTADTKKAQAQMAELQKALSRISLDAAKNNSLGLDKELTSAIEKAAQLKAILASSTTDSGELDLGKFTKSLKDSGTQLKDYAADLVSLGPQGEQAFVQLARSINSANIPLKRSNAMITEFLTTLKNTARWQISSSILHGFMGSVQSAYGYAEDLNESLNNIRIVTGLTTEEMADFAKEANKSAKALSTTTTAYADAALIFYQQGLDDNAVKERTDAVIPLPQPESVPVFFSILLIFPHQTFSQSETARRTHNAHARIKELRRPAYTTLHRTHSTPDSTFKHTGNPQDPADTKPLGRDGKTRSMRRHTDPGQRNCPVR